MNTKKQVGLLLTGAAANLCMVTEVTITDIRFLPFIDYNIDKHGTFEIEKVEIPVSRVFGPTKLLENRIWPMKIAEEINGWLAIVDHYGVDAEYTQAFFDSMKEVLVNIIAYGYINDGDDPNTAVRRFNGRTMTREEFYGEFFRLVVRYVPSKELKGDSPFTTWAK